MAELRPVDPRTLLPNPNNARRTPVPAALDEQMVASIVAVGILQPPRVFETPEGLTISAGHRRVKNAITAGKTEIDVIVVPEDQAGAAMASAIENLIRAPMTAVDTWRSLGERLSGLGWNEQAIADALNLPLRRVRCMKLLANVHAPMLDVMAAGCMPNDGELRTIASASPDEQAQVWKKYRPKKGQTNVAWMEVARALSKRRMQASAAKFGDDLARAYGIEWEEDLFAPPNEDGRYTTNVEGFLGAQQEWMQNNLPKRGTIVPVGTYGEPVLPKKAERVYGTPIKTDCVGHYVDPRSGAIETVPYRMPAPKKPVTPGAADNAAAAADTGDEPPATSARPDITQKGTTMIGDFRTGALHQALSDRPIEDDTLLGMLVLAFACDNVTVVSGAGQAGHDRRAICESIIEGGFLSDDLDTLRKAARRMLISVLSCRDNASQSGPYARIAGEAIGASTLLPNMATEDFLSCLSRKALETVAADAGVSIGARVRDTRAHFIAHHAGGTYVHPAALFRLTDADSSELASQRDRDREWNEADDTDADAGKGSGTHDNAEAQGGVPDDLAA